MGLFIISFNVSSVDREGVEEDKEEEEEEGLECDDLIFLVVFLFSSSFPLIVTTGDES